MRKLSVFAGLLFITLLTQSCASDPSSGRAELKNTGEADIHAVSDERIKVLMQNLKAQTYNRYDSALESEKEQAKYFREIADIAEEVGRSAKSVAFLGVQQPLNQSERVKFLGFADKLSSQAGEIKVLADSGKDRALRNKMNQMIGTCNSCHDNFRVMPGGVK
ncbi:Cytochrome C' [Mariprofundus aestuarium]|uniref:Cytochrome C n=1 Tax=Mariprofundus aestuarium TaxID=1921086 RepID=A0A2K8L0G2_MARES|nr:cytochrome c [Mariprofundus aestuarium]ATX79689.1 Cytochrome C' [Mariprofundus aestuarium]